MPIKSTEIIIPMQKHEPGFSDYLKNYKEVRRNLKKFEYENFDDFYSKNCIRNDAHYINIIRAGSKRPKCFVRRQPSEKWINQFNPFILKTAKSNWDIQSIIKEYSCAQYVVEYVNKTNQGVSDLQRKILDIMDQNPDFPITEITRKLGVDMLNTVEMSSQEAAWFLIGQPMSQCSEQVVSIPTMWPKERQRVRRRKQDFEELPKDSTNIWQDNWIDEYEKRPQNMGEVTLAQFVSRYYLKKTQTYELRKRPRIIRWRGYDKNKNKAEYKREMVQLHWPFRNENDDPLDERKF